MMSSHVAHRGGRRVRERRRTSAAVDNASLSDLSRKVHGGYSLALMSEFAALCGAISQNLLARRSGGAHG